MTSKIKDNFNAAASARMLKSLDTLSFAVEEKSYRPRTHIARHTHGHPVMSFTLSGSFIETNSFSGYTCERFGLSINPAGESHAIYSCDRESHCMFVEVVPQTLTALGGLERVLESPFYLRSAPITALVLRTHQELKQADAVSPLMVEGLMLEILAFAARVAIRDRQGNPPRWLLRVRDYLHAHFNGQISLHNLAETAGVHPAHLSRMFRRQYRQSVGEYVRALRLESSVSKLSDTEKPLTEIAIEAGFYDQSHFANAFRRHTGMTPAEFRRSHSRSSHPKTF